MSVGTIPRTKPMIANTCICPLARTLGDVGGAGSRHRKCEYMVLRRLVWLDS